MMNVSRRTCSFFRVGRPHAVLLLGVFVAASSTSGQSPSPRTAVERALVSPGQIVRTTVVRSWGAGTRGLLIERLHVISGDEARDGLRITWRVDPPPWRHAFIDADESAAVRSALTAMLALVKATSQGNESNYERLSFVTRDGIEFAGDNIPGSKFGIQLTMPNGDSMSFENDSVPKVIEALAP